MLIEWMEVFAKMSVLSKLFEHYPATNDPSGDSQPKQTVKVGIVRYRKCVTVSVATEGLFLWVCPPLGRQKRLLIPWDEIKQISCASLYGRQGVQMLIGYPELGEVTVYSALFESIRPFLRGTAQVEA